MSDYLTEYQQPWWNRTVLEPYPSQRPGSDSDRLLFLGPKPPPDAISKNGDFWMCDPLDYSAIRDAVYEGDDE